MRTYFVDWVEDLTGHEAITLWPVGVFVMPGELTATLANHEWIHWKQARELLGIGFYLLYGIFWAINMVRLRDWDKAYRANPFEREAHAHEHDPAYVATRPRFGWIHYVRSDHGRT